MIDIEDPRDQELFAHYREKQYSWLDTEPTADPDLDQLHMQERLFVLAGCKKATAARMAWKKVCPEARKQAKKEVKIARKKKRRDRSKAVSPARSTFRLWRALCNEGDSSESPEKQAPQKKARPPQKPPENKARPPSRRLGVLPKAAVPEAARLRLQEISTRSRTHR